MRKYELLGYVMSKSFQKWLFIYDVYFLRGMPVTVQGARKVRAIRRDGAWEQRFIIRNSDFSDNIYPGIVGTQVEASGSNWSIQVQARDINGGPWLDSAMRIEAETASGISVARTIYTNDQGAPDDNFTDLVLEIRKKQDPIIKIVQRPYAINSSTLMVNPDGIFIAAKGIQIMAV
jgi:hypothetical protein